MKKSTLSAAVVIVLAVIIGIIWYGHSGSSSSQYTDQNGVPAATGSTTPVISSTETTKVSDKISSYENDELGFSVKYPTSWEREDSNSGVTFIVPIDATQVSTVATLQTNIQVVSGTCAFPPVTTIQDRGTLTVGSSKLNMITMSNSVQGRDYFDRMYSLQSGGICYIFHFASISVAPSSKNLSGSQATQAQNNNKAIVNSTDADFTNMVKSFAFVTGPAGIDESKASPAK